MAFVNTTDRASVSVFDRVAEYFSDLRVTMVKRRMYNRTVAELEALTSRELSDLGLHRGTIRSAATEAVYGR